LAALGVLLTVTGRSISRAYEASGAATCGTDCDGAFSLFLDEVLRGGTGTLYDVVTLVLFVVPALVGIFWGAPLVARELETGTYRVAWTQSVSRTRWLMSKLAVVGGATVAVVGVCTAAVTLWAQRIDTAVGDRILPGGFTARGVVPVGYALFALALGTAAGVLIRRTVPAMAVTVAGYAAVAVAFESWIRARLVAPVRTGRPFDMSALDALMIGPEGEMTVIGSENLPDAWVLTNQTVTPAGEVFTGPADPRFCAEDVAQRACDDWVDSLGLRQELVFHPADHFWPLQWIELGLLVVAAASLVALCFWWVRRRLT